MLSGWDGGTKSNALTCDCHSQRLRHEQIATRVSDMEEFEEDEETLTAIDRGIKAADEGRTVSLEEVRKMIPEWTRKVESRRQQYRTPRKRLNPG